MAPSRCCATARQRATPTTPSPPAAPRPVCPACSTASPSQSLTPPTSPGAARPRRYALDPSRARVLAGGVEIIDAVGVTYAVDRVRVTIHGLRTGMILAYLENGDRWPEG